MCVIKNPTGTDIPRELATVVATKFKSHILLLFFPSSNTKSPYLDMNDKDHLSIYVYFPTR